MKSATRQIAQRGRLVQLDDREATDRVERFDRARDVHDANPISIVPDDRQDGLTVDAAQDLGHFTPKNARVHPDPRVE